MVRAAPAKNRSSSEQIGSSSAASDFGLPTLADSIAASSSAWRSTASASASNASIRCPGVVSRQPTRAARAAARARFDVSMVEWTAYEFLQAGRFTHSERDRVVRAAERTNRELRP